MGQNKYLIPDENKTFEKTTNQPFLKASGGAQSTRTYVRVQCSTYLWKAAENTCAYFVVACWWLSSSIGSDSGLNINRCRPYTNRQIFEYLRGMFYRQACSEVTGPGSFIKKHTGSYSRLTYVLRKRVAGCFWPVCWLCWRPVCCCGGSGPIFATNDSPIEPRLKNWLQYYTLFHVVHGGQLDTE